ncbi:hypothetical protein APB85_07310 [Salegentibacter mishustinae]|nr:hypothetical protein APB85_07310 [Salegentibacter mishustinae]
MKIKLQVHIPKKISSNIFLRALKKLIQKIRNKEAKNIKSKFVGRSIENPVMIPRIRNMESFMMVKFKNCIPVVFCRAAII